MIDHGQIERLEHLINLIDSKKDDQDERIRKGYCLTADYDLDEQLSFPSPEITDGRVTENSFYRWINQLSAVYQREHSLNAEVGRIFKEIYGEWDQIWAGALPSLDLPEPDDEAEELRVVADTTEEYDGSDPSEQWKHQPRFTTPE